MCVCVYIYTYIERDRGGDRDRETARETETETEKLSSDIVMAERQPGSLFLPAFVKLSCRGQNLQLELSK